MKTDQFKHPDYYLLDDLLSDEQKLIRDTAREWVKKEVSPIIEEHYEKATFPMHLLSGLGEIGAFGPYIPVEYGGAGLDHISYGIIMQELERWTMDHLCFSWQTRYYKTIEATLEIFHLFRRLVFLVCSDCFFIKSILKQYLRSGYFHRVSFDES